MRRTVGGFEGTGSSFPVEGQGRPALRLWIQLSISDSSQPTLPSVSFTCFGNLPLRIKVYMVDFFRSVRSITSFRPMILVGWGRSKVGSTGSIPAYEGRRGSRQKVLKS